MDSHTLVTGGYLLLALVLPVAMVSVLVWNAKRCLREVSIPDD